MREASFRIASLDDIESIEREPVSARGLAPSTYELLHRTAVNCPDKTALRFIARSDEVGESTRISYRRLLERLHQTANLLTDLGIGPTDVVSVLLPNMPQSHFALWGGEAAGIVSPINPLLKPQQIEAILKASRSRILITASEAIRPDIWEKVACIRKSAPSVSAILAVSGPGEESDGIYSFDDLLEKYPSTHLQSGRQISPGEIAAYFHTGGTTAEPKLAMHTHANEVFTSWAVTQCIGIEASDVILCGMPLFHVNAAFLTGLAPFSVGAEVVLLGPDGYRDPRILSNFWKIVECYRATKFTSVPTVLGRLLRVPQEDADLRSLRYAACGAAPLSVELFRTFEARTGVKLLEGYGLTEGGVMSCGNPPHGERRIGSIGLRIPYQQTRVVRPDEDGGVVDCSPGDTGTLMIRGPNVFPGYLNPEQTRGILSADGWLNTGDLVRQDDDGYFFVVGRARDVIIRSGHNIDPRIIEEALYRHEAVALAAAVGKPDPDAGELPVAYVQLKPGERPSERELLAHVASTISEQAATPKEIFIVEEIPVTAVGKIWKPALRWDAIARTLTAALLFLKDGDVGFSVHIGNDEQRGVVATIRISCATRLIEASRRAAERVLAQYGVPFDVVFEAMAGDES